LRVLRVYHGGRNAAHRARERALRAAGLDVALVVPATWPEGNGETRLSSENFPIFELPIARPADVNRYAYSDPGRLERLIRELKPDALDIHEEPFSVAARQWLAAAPAELPIVMYTAQNVDKRFPPPFSTHERRAHRRVTALYPCSRQAASVARGKGFAGLIEVIPLGYEPSMYREDEQKLGNDEFVLGLFGRLVPEKGVTDAVRVLARLNAVRPTRLVVAGSGPEEGAARELAASLEVTDRLEFLPWQSSAELAATYRTAHVVLVPSRPTETWVEQFGRVIVEAQASGAVVAGYASGSIPEVGGDATILADVGDVSQLAERVVQLASDPAEYARRREKGIALSRTRTWTTVAERQASLYRDVARSDVQRLHLPRSPEKRRAAARAEFGPTATTTAGTRPFALPLLRRGGTAVSALAGMLDAAGEMASLVGDGSSTTR
jgi:glycosyltransferase involved in cell wall biosynthesis